MTQELACSAALVLCLVSPVLAQSPGSFAVDKASCPPTGSDKNGVALKKTSDGGLRNMAKRHVPAGQAPKTLDLADFEMLQADVSQKTGVDAAQKKSLFAPTREALQHVNTAHGPVSEGDLVQVAVHVTIARDEHPESVNCAGTDGMDIHLSLGPQGATEYRGIVGEIIPQLPKPAGWDSATLNRLHAAQLSVLVVGGLTYDNEHLVNGDPNHKKAGQPARMSLWEVHPITEFYVCESGSCDPAQHSQWTTLIDWARKHPH
jgi:hypothetical protein